MYVTQKAERAMNTEEIFNKNIQFLKQDRKIPHLFKD